MIKLLSLLPLLFLVSCGSNPQSTITRRKIGNQTTNPFDPNVPKQLLNKNKKLDDDFSPLVLPGDQPKGTQHVALSQLPALPDASDLVWTDPDAPEMNLGSVEQAFTKPVKDEWQLSLQTAQRLSYATGKPLMVWFTDSERSPYCKRLGSELLNTKEFKEWAENNVILLRVDSSPKEQDQQKLYAKEKYAQNLRKKYNIRANPTILMIGHNGTTYGRYKGYRAGEGDYRWGQLKNAANTITNDYQGWKQKLSQSRYRLWTGKNGVQLFAKPTAYDKGRILLVEPNGKRTGIHAKHLSSKDQKWVISQLNRTS